jgi:hypothetical protein
VSDGPEREGWSIHLVHAHFHRRLYERYGVILEFGEFSIIKRALRYAPRIADRGRNGGVYAVRLPGRHQVFFVGTTLYCGMLHPWTAFPADTYRLSEGRWIPSRIRRHTRTGALSG